MQKRFLSYTCVFLSNTHTTTRSLAVDLQDVSSNYAQITFRRLRDVTLRARHWPHFLLNNTPPPALRLGWCCFQLATSSLTELLCPKKELSLFSYGSAVPNWLIPSKAKDTNGCEKVITFNHSRRNLRRFISFQDDSCFCN
jgi:hypothetical protein